MNMHYNRELVEEFNEEFKKEFNKEWNPDCFDWENESKTLVYDYNKYLAIWWDADKLNWKAEHVSIGLAFDYVDRFDKWWDPDKFDWVHGSYALAQGAASLFDVWWDPKKFNWKYCSYLPKYCSEYFDKWWDANLFNWEHGFYTLAEYCSDRFHTWWDAENFDWINDSKYLAKYCFNYFDEWWDPERYNWGGGSYLLACYCSSYFDKWWDPDEFNWDDAFALDERIDLSKFSKHELKALLIHPNANARRFAEKILRRSNLKPEEKQEIKEIIYEGTFDKTFKALDQINLITSKAKGSCEIILSVSSTGPAKATLAFNSNSKLTLKEGAKITIYDNGDIVITEEGFFKPKVFCGNYMDPNYKVQLHDEGCFNCKHCSTATGEDGYEAKVCTLKFSKTCGDIVSDNGICDRYEGA